MDHAGRDRRRTERLIIGPLVTPLARRRPHQLARETVTLDRLSGGRLVLGVGLGSERSGEFDPERFGEEGDPKARARLLDDGIDEAAGVLGRRLRAAAVQRPRSRSGSPRAGRSRGRSRRAARYDGLFPIDLPGPDALAELVAEHRRELTGRAKLDIVVTNPAGTDPRRGSRPGATWCLTGFGAQPTFDEVRTAIDQA